MKRKQTPLMKPKSDCNHLVFPLDTDEGHGNNYQHRQSNNHAENLKNMMRCFGIT